MAAGLSATVDAADVERLLGRVARGMDRAGADAGLQTAREVADRARGNLPRRTGQLAGSVRVDPTTDGASLVVGAPYAAWIEYGGSRGRAFVPEGRYVGPAADGAADDMAATAARNFEREV